MFRLIHTSRLMSRKTRFVRLYSDLYHDAKLQQIIETSNMAPKKRQLKEESERLKPQREEKDLPKVTSANFTDSALLYGKTVANSETRAGSYAAADAGTKPHQDTNAASLAAINTEPNSSQEGAETSPSAFSGVSSFAEAKIKHLRSWKSAQAAKFAAALPRVASAINSVTGYDQIELHKKAVSEVEQQLEEARSQVRQQKCQYEEAIERRSSSQKEINELLTRKHEWTPHDVERFTELYKNDHLNQQQENSGKVQLDEAENRFELLQAQLTSSILTRYHEEQLWSDKIRGASTWGTWMLMGVNIALFAVATFFVEPWKRKKLVTAFEAEVAAKLSEFSEEIHGLSSSIESRNSKKAQLPAMSDLWSAIPVQLESLQIWASSSLKQLEIWLQNAYTKLCQSPNFQFLQSRADISVFSSLLILLGWSLRTWV